MIRRPDFRRFLAENYAKRKRFAKAEEKREYIDRLSGSFSFAVFEACKFCFVQVIKDLYVIPFFMLTVLIAPWRMVSLVKTAYRYADANKVSEEIALGRQDIFERLALGFMDWRTFVELVILIMLPYRLPFLIAILRKNVFRSEKEVLAAETKQSPTEDSSKSRSSGLSQNQQPKTKRLTFHKCVHITFKEFCKDAIYLPFGILSVLLAPWRIITIYGIVKSQTERVPGWENYRKIHSKRGELVDLFMKVLTYDLLCEIMTLGLILTLYKIPTVLKIYNSCLKVMFSGSQKVRIPNLFGNNLVGLLSLTTFITYSTRNCSKYSEISKHF